MDWAETLFTSVVQAAVEQTRSSVGVLLDATWDLFAATTVVDITSGGFVRVYNLVLGMGVLLTLMFFLLQLVIGLLHRDPGAFSRAVSGLVKSVLGSFLVVSLTATALSVTDGICDRLVEAAGTSMEQIGVVIAAAVGGAIVVSGPSPGAPVLLALIVACLALSGTFLVWLGLLTRQALLLVSIALAPLVLAGAAWDATRGWVQRWLSFVAAMVLCKLVLVVVLLLAAQLLTSSPFSATPLASALTGTVLLLVAGFAPYMTYKLVSFVGFDLYTAMSVEQETKHALNRPVPVVSTAALLGGGGRSVPTVLHSGGTAGAAAGPVGAGVSLAAGAAALGPRIGAVLGAQASAMVPDGGDAASTSAARSSSGTLGKPAGGRPQPAGGKP